MNVKSNTESTMPEASSYSYDINKISKSAVFKRRRIMIKEFPCYGSQGDLDHFTALAIASNMRSEKNFKPCVDCDSCFQTDMRHEGKCRYPNASFHDEDEPRENSGNNIFNSGERSLLLVPLKKIASSKKDHAPSVKHVTSRSEVPDRCANVALTFFDIELTSPYEQLHLPFQGGLSHG